MGLPGKCPEKNGSSPERSFSHTKFYHPIHKKKRAAVMEILAEVEKAHLVLQPSNSNDIALMCCCCSVLTRIKRHPRPSELVASHFMARHEPETCDGCGICVDRCQMEAFTLEEDRVVSNSDRCIGCGLCVSTCPTGSLTLVRKPASRQAKVSATLDAVWRELAQT